VTRRHLDHLRLDVEGWVERLDFSYRPVDPMSDKDVGRIENEMAIVVDSLLGRHDRLIGVDKEAK